MPTGKLPDTLRTLLAAFAPCFTVRTFPTFQALAVGFLAQPGVRTVTGMLTAAGLAGRRHHDVAYRFFAAARWSTDQVGLVVASLIVTILPAGAPLLVAVDDTLLRRAGRKLHGAAWHHDGNGPSRHRPAWGHRWVVLGVLVWLPCITHRPLCLPVLARLWQPGDPDRTHRSSPASCWRCSSRTCPATQSTWSAMRRTPPARSAACPGRSPSPPGCAATRRCTNCPDRGPDDAAGRRSKATGCPS